MLNLNLLCVWVIFNFTYEFVASESRHNIQDASIGNKIGFLTNTDGREMVVANVCQEFKQLLPPDNRYCQNYCWDGYHVIIRLIGWQWFIVHSNYVNNKSKILVYFFHWWLWWRDWPSSPLFYFLSFPSILVYFCQIICKKWMQVLYFSMILQSDGIWHTFFKWHILWVLTWSFLSVFELNAF